jgi:hypothetical protein
VALADELEILLTVHFDFENPFSQSQPEMLVRWCSAVSSVE